MVPENQGQKKRQTSVSGKKEIAAEREFGEEIGIDIHVGREGAKVGQADKNRPDKNEEGDAFEGEGDSFRLGKREQSDENPKDDGAVNKNAVKVKDASIGEHDVGHGVARLFRRIDAGVKIRDQAGDEQNHGRHEREHEISVFQISGVEFEGHVSRTKLLGLSAEATSPSSSPSGRSPFSLESEKGKLHPHLDGRVLSFGSDKIFNGFGYCVKII